MSLITDLKEAFISGAQDTLHTAQSDWKALKHTVITTGSEAVQGTVEAVEGLVAFPTVVTQYLTGTTQQFGEVASWSDFGKHLQFTTQDNPLFRVTNVGNHLVLGGADLLTGHLLYSAAAALGVQDYTPWFTSAPTDARGITRDLATVALILATPAAKARGYAALGIPEKAVPVAETPIARQLAAAAQQRAEATLQKILAADDATFVRAWDNTATVGARGAVEIPEWMLPKMTLNQWADLLKDVPEADLQALLQHADRNVSGAAHQILAERPAAILSSDVSIAALAEDFAAVSKRNPAFIKWLTIFFADRGSYQLTDKAIEDLGSQYRNKGKVAQKPTIRQRKINAQVSVEKLIAEHGAEWVTEKGYISLPNLLPGQDLAGRRIIISNLVRLSGGNPKGITVASFRNNNLGGFLAADYYRGSPYDALVEGGFVYSVAEIAKASAQGKFETAKLYPWELMRNPEIFNKPELRIAATRWLVSKLGKDVRELGADDFNDHNLDVFHKYKLSAYAALVEAGYAYSVEDALTASARGRFHTAKIYPWEMKVTPQGLFNKPEPRIAATRWLVSKLGRDVRTLSAVDFSNNHLGGFIESYNYSPYAALVEAGYACSVEEMLATSAQGRFDAAKIYPWEMDTKTPTGFFDRPERRMAAVKWLVWKLGKDPRKIMGDDFLANKLSGLYGSHYKGSSYAALVAGGFVYSVAEIAKASAQGRFDTAKIYPWEMDAKTPMGIIDKAELRIAAVKWLVWKLGKDVRKITGEDFKKNRLTGFLNYYNGSPRAALAEAGLITP